jgi:hypothetical protein
MRKAAIISFSLIYLLVITGIPLTLHYCHGKLESVKILSSAIDGCCGNEGMLKGCCKNIHYLLKAETDHQQVSQVYSITVYDSGQSIRWQIIENQMVLKIQIFPLTFDNLPPPDTIPIWLINNSLTYYG